MTEPRFIDPALVSMVEMDTEEPEQFVSYRIPTHYRVKYMNKTWRRIYSAGFGKAYIVVLGTVLLIDDATMKRLTDLVPTGPVVNREQEIQKPERAPEMKEGMTDQAWNESDDIPF